MVFHIFALPEWYYRIFTHWEWYTLNNKRTWFCPLLYQIFTHDSQWICWDCAWFKVVQQSKRETKLQIWGVRMLKFSNGEGWLGRAGNKEFSATKGPHSVLWISPAPGNFMGLELMNKQHETSWEVQIWCREKPNIIKWTCMVNRNGRKWRWRNGAVNVKPALALSSSNN